MTKVLVIIMFVIIVVLLMVGFELITRNQKELAKGLDMLNKTIKDKDND